jgi:2-polyprenyl-3-methyl-5-hydroxy-6-metoxy-1,4-benzoquinol methylase
MRRDDWNAHWAKRDAPTAEPHARLTAELGSLGPGRALDLACGNGSNAVSLALRGFAVTAIDLSETAIAAGRDLAARVGVSVDWRVADLLDFTPTPAAYDLVLVFFLHLPAAARTVVFARAAAAVAPGGTLLVAAHDPANLLEGYRGPRDPDVLYGADEIAASLDGFVVETQAQIRRPIETAEGAALMVDAVVRARRPGMPAPG